MLYQDVLTYPLQPEPTNFPAHGVAVSRSGAAVLPTDCPTENGAWRSSVARLLWEQEVPGSNPGAPTGFSDIPMFPGDFEKADVPRVDLGERRKALAPGIIAPLSPPGERTGVIQRRRRVPRLPPIHSKGERQGDSDLPASAFERVQNRHRSRRRVASYGGRLLRRRG